MAHLPVIDLSKSQGSSREELRNELHKALTTAGFFYLKGVKDYNASELLSITKWFFDLPKNVKNSVTKKMFDENATRVYRGYFPIQPLEISHKEGFEIGPTNELSPSNINKLSSIEERILCESNQWPKSTTSEFENKRFEDGMKRYYDLLTDAGIELMKLIAEFWGLDSDAFTPLFWPQNLSTFRLLHYPQRKEQEDEGGPPAEAVDGKYILQCSEHKDSGFLTLLSTFDYEGLQIKKEEEGGGDWMDVPNMEGCLVVNIGELLATISGGVLKATNHRVVDKGEDRYSCPFFLEPSFDANVNIRLPNLARREPIPKGKKEPPKLISSEETIEKYGPWLIKKMQAFAEFRELLKYT